MFALVEQWKQSGKTRKEFCRDREVNPATFAYWVSKWKSRNSPAQGFARVDLSEGQGRKVEITYPNGVRLCTDDPDLALISRLIKLY